MNPNGGAIAIGHPLGASGARILGTPRPRAAPPRRRLGRRRDLHRRRPGAGGRAGGWRDRRCPAPRRDAADAHPLLDYAGLQVDRAARTRTQPLIDLPHRLTELTGPVLGDEPGRRARPRPDPPARRRAAWASGSSSTAACSTATARRCRDTLVEIWQANAAGRYRHRVDQQPAPLDPNFTGVGRCLTDAEGRYRFITIRPGAYPWGNHPNAWRPAHIHFSLFGRAFTQRLVTQMYFPGDPLFAHDPIFNSVARPERARERMVAALRPSSAPSPEWALAFRFDIVLRGRGRDAVRGARPMRRRDDALPDRRPVLLARHCRGRTAGDVVAADDARARSGSPAGVLDGAGEPVPDATDRDLAGDPDGRSTAAASAAALDRRATAAGGILTLKPGRPGRRRRDQAPHIDVSVFARGLLDRVVTRIYFADEEEANAADPLLARLDDRARATLAGRAHRRRLRDRHPPAGRG